VRTEHSERPKPLSAAIAGLCRELHPRVSEPTAVGLGEVLRRLSAPLQVAVAGRLKSGKSTLVNALIGRKVAPTAVGECTRLVTRFQYGTVDRVEVVFHDGRRRALPFEADGGIPANPGAGFDEVSHLEAYLTNAVLRELTVIDTPGLGSLDDASVRRTQQYLGAGSAVDHDQLDPASRDAVVGAEAVLYVVTDTVRADDRQALASFTAATAARDAGPLNVIAVLNKADMIEPASVADAGGDWRSAATIVAARQADLLKPRVAGVLPVIGLLAETAETGRFTSADADLLRKLAEWDSPTRDVRLLSADLFVSGDSAVSPADRGRLLELMDLHGIRRALESIDAEPRITAGALRRALLDASGLAPLLGKLDSVFRARADAIKASAALASLAALARACDDRAEQQAVRDGIETLLARPEAHQLRLLDALTQVASGAVAMPADLADEVQRIGGASGDSAVEIAEQLGRPHDSPRQLTEHVLERANWWRSFASFGATPAQSRVAHVVHRAYFLIWQQLCDNRGE
jgi:predicted GTPase